jgi:hypothetical protein
MSNDEIDRRWAWYRAHLRRFETAFFASEQVPVCPQSIASTNAQSTFHRDSVGGLLLLLRQQSKMRHSV